MTDFRRQEIERGIAVLRERGVTWKDWAKARGFSYETFMRVRRGVGPCVRGDSFRIAEALRDIGRARDPARGADPSREALEACEGVLAECLDAELEDLREMSGSGMAVISLVWDRSRALGRAARIEEALRKARAALGAGTEAP